TGGGVAWQNGRASKLAAVLRHRRVEHGGDLAGLRPPRVWSHRFRRSSDAGRTLCPGVVVLADERGDSIHVAAGEEAAAAGLVEEPSGVAVGRAEGEDGAAAGEVLVELPREDPP